MIKRLKNIGPAAMVAAAFIGPGTVTTATLAGSVYGYTLLWAIIFSVFATLILQEMSARLGVIGQMGVGMAIRQKLTGSFKVIAFILVISAILIGNSAYEAGNITGALLGMDQFSHLIKDYPINPFTLIIGITVFLLLFFAKYKLIEKSLIALVGIMGTVFIAVAVAIKPDFLSILKGMFVPEIPNGSLIFIIGLIGTTVVPYNLFLHASAAKEKWKGGKDISNARWDTIISVCIGGLITMAILIASTALNGTQQGMIQNISGMSIQLKPILGSASVYFMSIGFLAAGISSSITAPLAASYAIAGLSGWGPDIGNIKFKLIWIFVLITGIVFASLGFKPTLLILFAQVANGLLLPIIALFLIWIMNDRQIMGNYVNSTLTNLLALLVIIITIGLGAKALLAALGIL